MDSSQDPFDSTRRRPLPPRLRLSSTPSRLAAACLSTPLAVGSPSPHCHSLRRPSLDALHPASEPFYSLQRPLALPSSDPPSSSASNDSYFPTGFDSSVPPVPPLPPHLAHLSSTLPSSSNPPSLSSLTPHALLSKLDLCLRSKALEIQLAAQLGNSLLDQQSQLELAIAQLESCAAVDAGDDHDLSLSSHRKLPRSDLVDPPPPLSPLGSAKGNVSEEDELTRALKPSIIKKVQELEAEMQRWQEENADIWRQAKGEALITHSRPITPNEQVSPSPTQSSLTPSPAHNPPGIFPPRHLVPFPVSTSNQAANRRARNAQHRANDIEFATEIGQSLLGEVRRLQALLTAKEEEISDVREEREGLWDRNENLLERIKVYESSVEKFKEENWNLELFKQDLQTKLTDAQNEKTKVEVDRSRLTKQFGELQQLSDQQRAETERLAALLSEDRSKYETSLATLRKNHSGLQREKTDLQGQLEAVKLQVDRLKKTAEEKKKTFGGGNHSNHHEPDSDNPPDDDACRFMTPSKRRTGPDHVHVLSTPSDMWNGGEDEMESARGSPIKPQRGLSSSIGFATENDQLRTSLAHAQRTISTLRGALQRKKEDALRSKKSSLASFADQQSPAKRNLESFGVDDPEDDDCREEEGAAEYDLRRGKMSSSIRGTPRSIFRGRARGGIPTRRGRFRGTPSKLSKRADCESQSSSSSASSSELDPPLPPNNNQLPADLLVSLQAEHGLFDPPQLSSSSTRLVLSSNEPGARDSFGGTMDPDFCKLGTCYDQAPGTGSIQQLAQVQHARDEDRDRRSRDLFILKNILGDEEDEEEPHVSSELNDANNGSQDLIEQQGEPSDPAPGSIAPSKPSSGVVARMELVSQATFVEVGTMTDALPPTKEMAVQVEVEKVAGVAEVEKDVQVSVDRVIEVEKIVQVPVDRVVEVEKVVKVPVDRVIEVEKLVEVQVDRVVEVEKTVEVPVDRVIEVEKIVEVPVERVVEVEKIVQVPVERVVEVDKIVQVPVERVVEVEKIVQVPVERVVEVEKIVQVPVERVVEVDKIVQVPVDRVVEVEKIVQVPVDRVVEVEKIVQVPVDRVVEVEKIVQVPVDRLVEVEKMVEMPAQRLVQVEKSVQVPLGEGTEFDRPLGVSAEKVADRAAIFMPSDHRELTPQESFGACDGDLSDQPHAENIVVQVEKKTVGLDKAVTVEKLVEVEKVVERIVEVHVEVERVVEKIVEVPVEKIVEVIVEGPRPSVQSAMTQTDDILLPQLGRSHSGHTSRDVVRSSPSPSISFAQAVTSLRDRSKLSKRQLKRLSATKSHLRNLSELDSEPDQMFSADEEILDTDLEPDAFEDACDNYSAVSQVARSLKQSNAHHSTPSQTSVNLEVEEVQPRRSTEIQPLGSQSTQLADLTVRVITVDVGVQTETLLDVAGRKVAPIAEHLWDRNSVMTFGGRIGGPAPAFHPHPQPVKTLYTRPRASSHGSHGSRMEHLSSHGINSVVMSASSESRDSQASSVYSILSNVSDVTTQARLQNPLGRGLALRDPISKGSAKHEAPAFSLRHSQFSSSHSPAATARVPLDQRFVTPQSSSCAFRPQRPNSPPPRELLNKVNTPSTVASKLSVPRPYTTRRSSYSSMPPPSISREGKISSPGGSQNMNSPASRLNQSVRTHDEMGQFGMATIASFSRYEGRANQPGAYSNKPGSARSSVDQCSQRSRGQSFTSDRTSDPGEVADPGPPTGSSAPVSTDPKAIHAITQTMIGEFLYKYTTKTLTKGFSEKRHRRFFWVHPYTKTLYWSTSDPGAHGNNQSTAKSVFIENVKSVDDKNLMPPGLSTHSLVIRTPNREMKITAPTKERHDLWLNAIKYLLARPDLSSVGATNTPLPPSTSARPPRPPPSVPSGRAPMLSMARFRTQDSASLSTPPAVRAAIYGDGPATSRLADPVQRGTPRASKMSVLVGSNSVAKRMGKSASEFLRQTSEAPGSASIPKSSLRMRNLSLDRRVRRPGRDEMIEPVDETDVSMSYESRGDETIDDDGFEGLENVRACCNGKHDVGTLSRRHTLHSEQSQIQLAGRPPSRGPSSSIPVQQLEHHDGGHFYSLNARATDSPSLRGSNLQTLRSRFGIRPSSPGPGIGLPHSMPYSNTCEASPAVSDSHPVGLDTGPSRGEGMRNQREHRRGLMPDFAGVERLQTPPRSASRISKASANTSSMKSTRHPEVA